MIHIAVLYVGSSLLSALRRAEREINSRYRLGLRIACHNCTLPLTGSQWPEVERDLSEADIVFVFHVTDNENALRIAGALDRFRSRHHAAIVINCLGDLMRRTRLGSLDFASLFITRAADQEHPGHRLARKVASWMSSHARTAKSKGPDRYLKLTNQIPPILRFIPSVGRIGNIKHYLTLYCYFLQPTPGNIRSMILYAIRHYVPGHERIRTDPPESRPVMGIYHPDAPSLIPSFDEYRQWYERRKWRLDPDRTIGLLLLRPQVVSGAHSHYDELIGILESEHLPVIPVLSTFMDNRQACDAFFVDPAGGTPRISQLVSLTGFSFVGGPAMNDSEAAVSWLRTLNRPFRSSVSLETQRIDDWSGNMIGLNPVQTAMQVAIPEIDGATEPFVFGGLSAGKDQPEALPDRCRRIAGRLKQWNRLRTLPPSDVRLAFLIYCFPPNKGNLGTAADLDVFPSLWAIFQRLASEGYNVTFPQSPELLREMLLSGDDIAHVAYRLSVDDYYRLCPYVEDIEAEWGPAPGRINAQGRSILIHGVELGNIFLGVQPTFGYEGDPMRLLMAKGGTPHHGFMGLYTWLEKVFCADALIHVGTHGALEFMPGKQVGLSDRCWPDRLIGKFPNIYIYSVNNPSEGSIAKRRSYAELISYLTPPIENAGLYKELKVLKDLLAAYRLMNDEEERERIFRAIEETAGSLNLNRGESVGRSELMRS
jgi:magnesium chelatase subunit H